MKINPEIQRYIEEQLPLYYDDRIASVNKLKLSELITRKNPYLFCVKNLETSESFVKGLLEAHLSSSEETKFGNWMERFAIFVCGLYNQNVSKATSKGVDLDFKKDNIRYIISIKSGPNWGNNEATEKMIDNFSKISRSVRTSGHKEVVRFVNGCTYGKKNSSKDAYDILSGQRFWKLLTDDDNFYKDIVEPLGIVAKKRDDDFKYKLNLQLNRLTAEFSKEFVEPNGNINWNKIMELNSLSTK